MDKIHSHAPEGSSWELLAQRMGSRWNTECGLPIPACWEKVLEGERSGELACAAVWEEMGILPLFPGFYLDGFGASLVLCETLGCRCSWSGRWQLSGMLNTRNVGRGRGRSWLIH